MELNTKLFRGMVKIDADEASIFRRDDTTYETIAIILLDCECYFVYRRTWLTPKYASDVIIDEQPIDSAHHLYRHYAGDIIAAWDQFDPVVVVQDYDWFDPSYDDAETYDDNLQYYRTPRYERIVTWGSRNQTAYFEYERDVCINPGPFVPISPVF